MAFSGDEPPFLSYQSIASMALAACQEECKNGPVRHARQEKEAASLVLRSQMKGPPSRSAYSAIREEEQDSELQQVLRLSKEEHDSAEDIRLRRASAASAASAAIRLREQYGELQEIRVSSANEHLDENIQFGQSFVVASSAIKEREPDDELQQALCLSMEEQDLAEGIRFSRASAASSAIWERERDDELQQALLLSKEERDLAEGIKKSQESFISSATEEELSLAEVLMASMKDFRPSQNKHFGAASTASTATKEELDMAEAFKGSMGYTPAEEERQIAEALKQSMKDTHRRPSQCEYSQAACPSDVGEESLMRQVHMLNITLEQQGRILAEVCASVTNVSGERHSHLGGERYSRHLVGERYSRHLVGETVNERVRDQVVTDLESTISRLSAELARTKAEKELLDIRLSHLSN